MTTFSAFNPRRDLDITRTLHEYCDPAGKWLVFALAEGTGRMYASIAYTARRYPLASYDKYRELFYLNETWTPDDLLELLESDAVLDAVHDLRARRNSAAYKNAVAAIAAAIAAQKGGAMAPAADRQGSTIAALRENFDLHPGDWRGVARSKAGTLRLLDWRAYELIASEPERYASLSSEQEALLASEVAERFN